MEKVFSQKKIIHILADEPRGGVGTFLLNTLSNEYQYELIEHVIQKESFFNVEMSNRNIAIHAFPSHREMANYFVTTKEFYRVHAGQIAAIHVHSTAVAPIHLFWAQYYGVQNRIFHLHLTYLDGVSLLRRWRNKALLSLIFSLSTEIVSCGEKVGELVPKSRQNTVLPNTINVSDFLFNEEKRFHIRHELGLQNRIAIGIVGRISKEKNHKFLLDVFKNLPKTYVLVVIGEGPLEESLREKCGREGISNILFLGRQNAVIDYLHALDGLAMPSLVEGFPLVAIEAQANGLPCFFSDVIDKSTNVTHHVTFGSVKDPTLWFEMFKDFQPLTTKDRLESNNLVYKKFDVHVGRERLRNFYETIVKI